MGTHTNKHTYLDVHALMILKNNGAGDLAELLCACLAFTEWLMPLILAEANLDYIRPYLRKRITIKSK